MTPGCHLPPNTLRQRRTKKSWRLHPLPKSKSKPLPHAPPPADVEEEDIASIPPVEDEPTLITLNKVALVALDEPTPINLEEEELAANTTDDAPTAEVFISLFIV